MQKGFGFTNFELDFKDYILNTNKIRIVFKILTTELNFTYNFLKSKICKQKRFFFSSVQRNVHFESYQLQKQFGYAFFPRLILNMIKTRPQVISPIHKLRKEWYKIWVRRLLG